MMAIVTQNVLLVIKLVTVVIDHPIVVRNDKINVSIQIYFNKMIFR